MDGWLERAVCRHLYDPDVMFPDAGDHTGRLEASSVCSTCPVTAECFIEWSRLPRALKPYGVWAGRSGWQWLSGEGERVCRWCGQVVGGRRDNRTCSTECKRKVKAADERRRYQQEGRR